MAFSKQKLKLLYEQLEYLTMKMNSCSSPTYGHEFNIPSDPYKNQLVYWLDRLDSCESKIKKHETIMNKYDSFKESLNDKEQLILDKYFYQGLPPRMILDDLNVSRNRFYEIANAVERKYYS